MKLDETVSGPSGHLIETPWAEEGWSNIFTFTFGPGAGAPIVNLSALLTEGLKGIRLTKAALQLLGSVPTEDRRLGVDIGMFSGPHWPNVRFCSAADAFTCVLTACAMSILFQRGDVKTQLLLDEEKVTSFSFSPNGALEVRYRGDKDFWNVSVPAQPLS